MPVVASSALKSQYNIDIYIFAYNKCIGRQFGYSISYTESVKVQVESDLWEGKPNASTVGNFHRFSDIGDIVPQKWVKWTHRWIKCAENWFQIFLASGLYDHVAFGLETFVTLMKIGMLSRREKIFLHAKIQQIRSRNGWDTAQLMFLSWPFIYWLCKAVEANPRKSPKWAFHQ